MKYRIEDIVKYVLDNQGNYLFELREYASYYGEYHNEAVVFAPVVSDVIGFIIEQDPFNPFIYYTKPEMVYTLNRLNDKSKIVVDHMLKK